MNTASKPLTGTAVCRLFRLRGSEFFRRRSDRFGSASADRRNYADSDAEDKRNRHGFKVAVSGALTAARFCDEPVPGRKRPGGAARFLFA